ncbi:MAG: AAA family ATPase [Colwellia sp.]|nr:AAA family ATPase [Colwellia sp.]
MNTRSEKRRRLEVNDDTESKNFEDDNEEGENSILYHKIRSKIRSEPQLVSDMKLRASNSNGGGSSRKEALSKGYSSKDYNIYRKAISFDRKTNESDDSFSTEDDYKLPIESDSDDDSNACDSDDSDDDDSERQSKIDNFLDSINTKVNRASEDPLENISTDWKEGFENDEEAETYKEQISDICKSINSVPTVSQIMKIDLTQMLGNDPEENKHERRSLIAMRLKLDEQLDPSEWTKVRNTLNERVEYLSGQKDEVLEQLIRDLPQKHSLKDRIVNADYIPQDTKSELYNKYEYLQTLEPCSDESSKVRDRIEHCLKLPGTRSAEFSGSQFSILKSFKTQVDQELLGMKHAKEETMCFLQDMIESSLNNTRTESCILGLEGSPGMGKTSLAICIAKSCGLPFYKIALGGMQEPGLIRGEPFVHIGCSPGLIVLGMEQMGCNNGIILFDEIDKLNTEKSGVSNALLEVLDSSQNHLFRDSYCNITTSLSKMFFIVTMNDRSKVNPILLNRIQTIVKLPGYSTKEKKKILTKITIPKWSERLCVTNDFIFGTEAINEIVDLASIGVNKSDKGMRPCENILKTVLRKLKLYKQCFEEDDFSIITFSIENFVLPFTITKETVRKCTKHLVKEDDWSTSSMYM